MNYEKKGVRFEVDLRYHREFFRLREIAMRDKIDFFWGPFSKDRLLSRRINQNRLKRQRKIANLKRLEEIHQNRLTSASQLRTAKQTSNGNNGESNSNDKTTARRANVKLHHYCSGHTVEDKELNEEDV